MPPLGPFDVSGEQVERLRTAFTVFVNGLLDRERARAGLAGHELRTDS